MKHGDTEIKQWKGIAKKRVKFTKIKNKENNETNF